MITNVQYTVTPTKFPLGWHAVTLPDYIKRKKSIVTLLSGRNARAFKDNLCLFRAYYYHKHREIRMQGVQDLFKLLCVQTGCKRNVKIFSGVKLSDFPRFEDVFDVSLQVMTCDRTASLCHDICRVCVTLTSCT